MAEVGVAGLLDRVEVDVDDLVEVAGGHLGDLLEAVEVVLLVGRHELVHGDGGEVAHGHLNAEEHAFSISLQIN